MHAELTPQDRASLEAVVRQLESAWNAMDAEAFAAPFAIDADFVNIRAEHHRGRPAITAGHASIFQTIYAGSTVQFGVESGRLLNAGAALLHVRSELTVPAGALAGTHHACFSMVLARTAHGWEIAAFHNTLEPPQK